MENKPTETNLDQRYQTLVVLWFALLMSIGMYFLFSLFVGLRPVNDPRTRPGSLLIIALTALGTFLVIMSFAVKGKFLQRAVENQDVSLVQKGLIVACAMCEVAALLGLLEYFIIGNREYYLLFLIAAAGTALHFPRRSQLESASYKNPWQLS
jgi:NADH:ubiquinone oxidoreductase subunit 2 (subunit N)